MFVLFKQIEKTKGEYIVFISRFWAFLIDLPTLSKEFRNDKANYKKVFFLMEPQVQSYAHFYAHQV